MHICISWSRKDVDRMIITKDELLKIVCNSFSEGKNIDIISTATTLGINV
jgi:hypothetical protein